MGWFCRFVWKWYVPRKFINTCIKIKLSVSFWSGWQLRISSSITDYYSLSLANDNFKSYEVSKVSNQFSICYLSRIFDLPLSNMKKYLKSLLFYDERLKENMVNTTQNEFSKNLILKKLKIGIISKRVDLNLCIMPFLNFEWKLAFITFLCLQYGKHRGMNWCMEFFFLTLYRPYIISFPVLNIST